MDECRGALQVVLPFAGNETEFLDRLLDASEVMPNLLTGDEELAERIASHPLLRWKALNVQQHKSR